MVKVKDELMKVEPYSPGKPIDEVKREMGLKQVVKLASNENPFGPSPLAYEALKSSIAEVNRYPDGGCYYLRKKLSSKLGVNEDELIFGNGSDELIVLSIKALTEKGDEVVIAKPTFLIYNIASTVSGLKIVTVPLKDFKYDLNQMAAKITRKTKIVFIANPDNPTGTYVDVSEVESFLETVPEDVVVFFDEAYFEYAQGGDYPDTLSYQGRENIITSRSFSKIYGLAGLRIGYAVSSKLIIDLMNRVREPFNVNSLAQSAALAALDDNEFVKKVKERTEKGKRMLYSELEKIGIEYIPSLTNFILVKIGKKSKVIYDRLLREGVIVRQMSAWGLDDYIRVTIGKEDENLLFISALRKVLINQK
jgi:histidinol-phosphate aminotransferase